MTNIIRLISFILLINNVDEVNAQFGEIASIVTGILGSGAGNAAGLGSLAGTAGTAGLTGASAGANALGQIGQLYQLAQAALQLTGTGVGIVNQASESAWFPAAVENIARTNREFQDRLLAGSNGRTDTRTASGMGGGFPDLFGGLRPPGGSVGTVGAGKSEIGTEFGTDLSSSEVPEPPEKTDLKGGHIGSVETNTVESKLSGGLQSLLPLPQKTLLPGEVGPEELGREELGKEELGRKLGKEEEPRNPSSPTITVQVTKRGRKPQVEFSTDSNEETFPLLPPRAISPTDIEHVQVLRNSFWNSGTTGQKSAIDAGGDNINIPQMVPELQKLLAALHKSNLTSDEITELTRQLESNRNIGIPRENTSPATLTPREPEKSARTKSPSEQAAIERNLQALRRVISPSTLNAHTIRKFSSQQDSPPVVLSMTKPAFSSTTDVKLPAPQNQPETLEAHPTTTQSPKSRDVSRRDRHSVRESVVDGGESNAQRYRANSDRRIQTVTTTTVLPLTTNAYDQYYKQVYAHYYQNQAQQHPHGHVYNFYAQNPFGHLFHHNSPQQPVPQNHQQHHSYQIPQQQQYYQQQYYSTTNQQQPTPRLYPLQHPLSSGSLLTLSQPREYQG